MGAQKGIENLSAEDQVWAKKIGRFGAWKKALQLAVQKNQPARVDYILQNHKMNRGFYCTLVTDAVGYDAGPALEVLLKKRGFDLTDSGSKDKMQVQAFFATAGFNKSLSVWKVLSKYNAENPSSCGAISSEMPVKKAAAGQWHEAVRFELDRAQAGEVGIFSAAVIAAGKQTPEDLAFVLSWAHKFSGYGQAFSAALATAVEEGALEKTRLLLDKGADPNADAGYVLFLALSRGHQAIFDLLLEKGGDLEHMGRDIETRLKQEAPTAPLLPYLTEKLTGAEAQSATRKAQKQAAERYKLLTPDSFSETLHLPDGGRLTTVFNFGARQQVTMAERLIPGQEQPAMAINVRDFDEIAGPDTLEQARQRLIALGGQAQETDIRGQMNKPVLASTAAQHASKPSKHAS